MERNVPWKSIIAKSSTMPALKCASRFSGKINAQSERTAVRAPVDDLENDEHRVDEREQQEEDFIQTGA